MLTTVLSGHLPLHTMQNLNAAMGSTQKGFKNVAYWKTYYCNMTGFQNAPPCAVCWKDYKFSSYFTATKASKETTYASDGSNQEKLKRVHLL